MEIALIVAGVLAAGMAVAVFWLLVERGRSAARVAGERAEAAAVLRERDESRARVTVCEAEARSASQESARLRVEAAQLGEQLASAKRDRLEDAEHARRLHERELESVRDGFAQEVEKVRAVNAEKLEAVEQARREIEKKLNEFDEKFVTTFRALAGEALRGNSEQFLTLAKEKLGEVRAEAQADIDKRKVEVDRLLKPIGEALDKTGTTLAEIEKSRIAGFTDLKSKIDEMLKAGGELRTETGKLVKALREPHVRGRYGELQLKRVAELAGMRSYCNFAEQAATRDDDGALLRPDMIVQLPNAREFAVDAKANLKPYLDALEATDPEVSEQHLQRFADVVADQAVALAKKGYWRQYAGSPDFVVMFLPGDGFLDAALARRHDLLDFAAERNVILASPASLIAMLRAVAVGFREAKLAADAQELFKEGRKLHERMATAMKYFAELGGALGTAVGKYNEFAGSYKERLAPTLRKFEEGGVKSAKELPAVVEVEARVREQMVQMRLTEDGGEG